MRGIGCYKHAPDDVTEISRGHTGRIVSVEYAKFVIRPQSSTIYASKMVPGLAIEFEGGVIDPAHSLMLRQGGIVYTSYRLP